MPTTIRNTVAVGGVVAAFAALSFASGSLFAQTAPPALHGTPMAGEMGMMGAATPEAGATQAAADMEQMMAQCMEMMEMMHGMMGGDMSGMMGDQGMAGGGDGSSPTPASGQ